VRASQGGGAKADRASFERRQRSEVRAGGASYAANFGCGALDPDDGAPPQPADDSLAV